MTSPMRAQIHVNWQRFGKVYEQCFDMIKKSIEEHGCKIEITFVEHDRIKDLESKLAQAVEGLERIKDGGVPCGVCANVQERMLAMVDIATEVLATLQTDKRLGTEVRK